MTKLEFLAKLMENNNLKLTWNAVFYLREGVTETIRQEAGLKKDIVVYWLEKLEEWGLIGKVSSEPDSSTYYVTAKGFNWARYIAQVS